MTSETLIASLEGEYYLLTLIGSIFHQRPEKALIASLADNRIFDDIPFGASNQVIQECFTKLQAWNDSCASPFSDKDFEDVLLDYTRLFVGLSKVPAPLWESVYFNRERMVFQEQTMDVRHWYRRYQLQVERFQHEPDDHIGSELLFIGHLSRLAKEAFEVGSYDRGIEILHDQSRFIEEHPSRWCRRWSELIEKTAQHSFYPACSQLVCAIIDEVLRYNAALPFAQQQVRINTSAEPTMTT